MKREVLTSNQGSELTLVEPGVTLDVRRVALGVITSRQTVASRRMARSDLRQIALTLQVPSWEAIPWDQMRADHLAVLRELLSETRSPITVNRILSTARSALKAVYLAGALTDREWAAIGEVKPAAGSREPRGRSLTEGEKRSLFVCLASDPSPKARRDAGILAVALGCGLRRAEIVGLAFDDYIDAATLRVLGKGNKERLQPVGPDVAAYLADWLEVRGPDDGHLFLAFDGKGTGLKLAARGMTSQAVYQLCKTWAERASVARFSPHDLRRSFVTALLDAGVDLSLAAGLAGHAQVETTRRYDRRPAEARRAAAGRLTLPVIRPQRLPGV